MLDAASQAWLTRFEWQGDFMDEMVDYICKEFKEVSCFRVSEPQAPAL